MLAQQEAEILRAIEKIFLENRPIFPHPSGKTVFAIEGAVQREKFDLSVYRGKINPNKCNFTFLYLKNICLFRIDTGEWHYHSNPDGEEVPTPHVHIYQEDFDAKFAYPLPKDIFTDIDNLYNFFYNILAYSNIINIEDVELIMPTEDLF